jgi:hypothetical protein
MYIPQNGYTKGTSHPRGLWSQNIYVWDAPTTCECVVNVCARKTRVSRLIHIYFGTIVPLDDWYLSCTHFAGCTSCVKMLSLSTTTTTKNTTFHHISKWCFKQRSFFFNIRVNVVFLGSLVIHRNFRFNITFYIISLFC